MSHKSDNIKYNYPYYITKPCEEYAKMYEAAGYKVVLDKFDIDNYYGEKYYIDLTYKPNA